ncbi:MAG TPA: tyrosine-protein phosphatase [Acidimicrobiales bacterium]|nr:tyrosine-protein phosphatase [Acidimicrobiales bacterium]
MSDRVTYLEAEGDGEGCLVVRWHLEEPGAVDISTGLTPLSEDHTPVLRVEAGTEVARLSGLSPGRHYVSVARCSGGAALVGAERRLPFEGVRNFRDLGGYPTVEGTRVRWGTVYRSDGLHQMTQADLLAFKMTGVRVVYDLRGTAERSEHPGPVEPIAIELVSSAPGEDRLALGSGATRLDAERLLRDVYVGMLVNSAPLFGQLFSGLTIPEHLPAVFHCAGGKDRTGMAAVLLLSALGVAREVVLDDYQLTQRWRTVADEPELFHILVGSGVPEEAATAFLGAPRWAMADALKAVDDVCGGIAAYLRGPAGMGGRSVAALPSLLTA